MLTNKIFFILALAILFVAAAAAQDDVGFNGYRFEKQAIKGSNISNLDLLRKIFPDAQIEKDEPEAATALKSIPLRHLFGAKNKKTSDDAMTLNISERQETGDGERGQILWLIVNAVQPDKTAAGFRANWTAAILAAFRVSRSSAELLDAADVATQNISGFAEDVPQLRLAPRREAVVVSNISNASVGHSELSVIAAGNKGFNVLIDQFVMTTEYRCTDWYSEEASLRTLKNSTNGSRDVEITVKIEGGPGEAENARVKFRRRFRYVFRWQPQLEKYKAVVNPDRQRRTFLKQVEPCREYSNR